MIKYRLCVAVLLLPCLIESLFGLEIKSKKGSTYPQYTIVELTGDSDKDTQYLWDVDNTNADFREVGNKLYLTGPPGTYKVVLTAINFTTKSVSRARYTIIITGVVPPPPDSISVTVIPASTTMIAGSTVQLSASVSGTNNKAVSWDATGPATVSSTGLVSATSAGTATITATSVIDSAASGSSIITITGVPPSPAPIPLPGFRVLIVEDAVNRSKLPAAQYAVIFDKSIRDFLRTNCVKDSSNPNGAWRIWDKGTDATSESKDWQDALKRDRKSLPWIIISNGKTGYEGLLPGTVSDTMSLLQKYSSTTKKKSRAR